MYVDTLRQRHVSIDEVWVLGPKANDEAKRRGEWQLLAFADASTLAALRRDGSVHRGDVSFMVVTDGDRFESAWGTQRSGRLSDIEWRLENPHVATYTTDRSTRESAVRVR